MLGPVRSRKVWGSSGAEVGGWGIVQSWGVWWVHGGVCETSSRHMCSMHGV